MYNLRARVYHGTWLYMYVLYNVTVLRLFTVSTPVFTKENKVEHKQEDDQNEQTTGSTDMEQAPHREVNGIGDHSGIFYNHSTIIILP